MSVVIIDESLQSEISISLCRFVNERSASGGVGVVACKLPLFDINGESDRCVPFATFTKHDFNYFICSFFSKLEIKFTLFHYVLEMMDFMFGLLHQHIQPFTKIRGNHVHQAKSRHHFMSSQIQISCI